MPEHQYHVVRGPCRRNRIRHEGVKSWRSGLASIEDGTCRRKGLNKVGIAEGCPEVGGGISGKSLIQKLLPNHCRTVPFRTGLIVVASNVSLVLFSAFHGEAWKSGTPNSKSNFNKQPKVEGGPHGFVHL